MGENKKNEAGMYSFEKPEPLFVAEAAEQYILSRYRKEEKLWVVRRLNFPRCAGRVVS